MAVYLGGLVALYLCPLGMYSPCIMEKGTLGPAPGLIGHRGTPMVSWPTLSAPVSSLWPSCQVEETNGISLWLIYLPRCRSSSAHYAKLPLYCVYGRTLFCLSSNQDYYQYGGVVSACGHEMAMLSLTQV